MSTPIVPVILAGGRGERFWPLSRQNRPKQFLALDGTGRSLLRATAERLLPLAGDWANLLVVTAAPLVSGVRKHLPELPEDNLLVEPEGRDTGPAVALAALSAQARRGPDCVLGVFPANHWIGEEAAFQQAVVRAAAVARARDVLVTFGVQPTYPATGYGYIERGEELGDPDGVSIHRVAQFVEKPDAETAARYLASGRFLWNSGMFVWRAGVVLAELRRHAPQVVKPLEEAFPDAVTAAYGALPRISVDYALLEKTDRVVVLPASFGWDDLGDWTALERLLRGQGANVVVGRHVGFDTRGSILYTTGDDLIVTIGLEDMIIVRDSNVTLIVRKDRIQELKRVLAQLNADPRLAWYT
ncbi:mannose-1-phosphate guanylyltransferase [Caldinitratiruptor microaerophilus]|uniref:mannose-1-phosphate guanylyltransferase n=1 Tax=Caldinitratiruptor microaerophilus TaxID=671077 RepID=A0AA35G9J7_9FIRM|nr:mannose-1-phosphate guanylyltransferase [Caldinitratiruptor microaerophilus]BDG60364.1 mannose-1-phosphate guanylyltransferase [Caldinitratiruptor microaerophilus]